MYGWGLGPKNLIMINGLELLVPLPPTSGEGRGAEDEIKLLMTNDLINNAYPMKPP